VAGPRRVRGVAQPLGPMFRLPAALDAQLQVDAGLSFVEYMVLAMLSESPGRSRRMSELAALTGTSLSRLSHLAACLHSKVCSPDHSATVEVPPLRGASMSHLPRQSLSIAGLGTLLTLVAFTAPLSTLNATAAALDADVAGRTWILSSISIGLAAALLSAGTIADDFGRRRTFIVGMVILAVGSIVSALVSDVTVFVLARVMQGVGGAAVVASSLGIIAHAYAPGPERAKASGVWGASVGAGIAIGPLMSAGLEESLSWRAAYWVVAIAAIGLAVGARLVVDESRSPDPKGLDLVGTLVLAAGMSSLLAALVEGRQGWTEPAVLALGAAAIILLVVFVAVEARGSAPMLDLKLFGQPRFVAATTAAFTTGMGLIALFSFMPGFVGIALGISALDAAFLLFVWSGTSVVTALLARHLPARIPGQVELGVGLIGIAAGQLVLLGVSESSSWTRFLPGLLVTGLASGVVNAALGREAVASVSAGRGGMGSGANNTARYVGSAIGVTIVAVIATRPRAGSPLADLVHGWNVAVVVTAAISLLGGLVVLACFERTPHRRHAAKKESIHD
jgi:MFS family permease